MKSTDTKHTSGPWEILAVDDKWSLSPWRAVNISGSVVQGTPPMSESDARLIAAAPDALDALKELVAEFDVENEREMQQPGVIGINETEGVKRARAAIAKAEGCAS